MARQLRDDGTGRRIHIYTRGAELVRSRVPHPRRDSQLCDRAMGSHVTVYIKCLDCLFRVVGGVVHTAGAAAGDMPWL